MTERDRDHVAVAFEAERPHLRAVGYRLLGSVDEAEDAVQEAWLRLDRADLAAIDNIPAWLTTVTSRICLDQLRSRSTRRESVLADTGQLDAAPDDLPAPSPEDEAVRSDAIGRAMLVVLDALTPPERVAFVLHDMFAVPFEAIAPIVGRETAATRQLASRARRRVQDAEQVPDRDRQRVVVEAFLSASRHGEFEDLLELLDPEAVARADAYSVARAAENPGAPQLTAQIEGASAVAKVVAGRAAGAQPAFIDGTPGFAWAPGGIPRAIYAVTVQGGRIVAIDQQGDPAALAGLDIELFERLPLWRPLVSAVRASPDDEEPGARDPR